MTPTHQANAQAGKLRSGQGNTAPRPGPATGRMAERRLGLALGLSLAAGTALAQAPLNPGTTIVNHTGAPIEQVFIAATGTPQWGDDKLGGTPVQPGAQRQLQLVTDRTCIFDIRAVFAGGRTEERHRVDICKREEAAFGEAAR